MSIEVHAERCSGCRLCQQICAISHFREINPKKSAIYIRPKFPVPGGFEPELCDQCGDCEAVCPSGAIRREGAAFVIDRDQCTLCEECIHACPSGAIRIPPQEEYPFKCDLCLKCVQVCNTSALVAKVPVTERKDIDKCLDSVGRLSA